MTLRESSLATDEVRMTAFDVVLARTRPLLARRPLLIASDFDGTLAVPMLDPWATQIIPTAQRALRRLAGAPGIDVALVSGRTVRDLAWRTRIGGISYYGDHGSEYARVARGFRAGSVQVQRESTDPDALSLVSALVDGVPRAVPEVWLVVEDKVGSVTFHFRSAPDLGEARRRIVAAIDAIDTGEDLTRHVGSRAIELRAAGASTKAHAIRQLLARHRPAAAIMLGDDRSDAVAFETLHEARRDGSARTLAIGVAGHSDATAEIASRADLMLAGPAQVARLLGALARSVS